MGVWDWMRALKFFGSASARLKTVTKATYVHTHTVCTVALMLVIKYYMAKDGAMILLHDVMLEVPIHIRVLSQSNFFVGGL